MSDILRIEDESGQLLAYKVSRDTPEGLQAYSEDGDYVQVLSWHYAAGRLLQNHIHREVPRTATLTQEAVVVISGRVRADVFDEQRRLAAQVVVKPGECMVLLRGGHGYEILEDDTQVFEIKNGPFLGVEADKEKF